MQRYIDPDLPDGSPAEQMLALARAYADGARIQCEALIEGRLENEALGVRELFQLCRLATELFLKGSVVVKTRGTFPKTHHLPDLYSQYISQFPLQGYELEVPFGIWPLFEVEDLEDTLGKSFHDTHDQRFRYPLDNRGRAFSEEYPFHTERDAKLVFDFVSRIKNLSTTIEALQRAAGGA